MTDNWDKRPIQSFMELRVWKEAMDLAVTCYSLTSDFPRQEMYGLTSQLRRAAVSVPANIAEGYGRDNLGSYLQHLKIAQGSLRELQTHILIAERVKVAQVDRVKPVMDQCETVAKMLNGLIRALQRNELSK